MRIVSTRRTRSVRRAAGARASNARSALTGEGRRSCAGRTYRREGRFLVAAVGQIHVDVVGTGEFVGRLLDAILDASGMHGSVARAVARTVASVDALGARPLCQLRRAP